MQFLLLELSYKCEKVVSFKGASSPGCWPGALSLDATGGYAPDPKYRLMLQHSPSPTKNSLMHPGAWSLSLARGLKRILQWGPGTLLWYPGDAPPPTILNSQAYTLSHFARCRWMLPCFSLRPLIRQPSQSAAVSAGSACLNSLVAVQLHLIKLF